MVTVMLAVYFRCFMLFWPQRARQACVYPQFTDTTSCAQNRKGIYRSLVFCRGDVGLQSGYNDLTGTSVVLICPVHNAASLAVKTASSPAEQAVPDRVNTMPETDSLKRRRWGGVGGG